MKGHGHYPEGDNRFFDREERDDVDTCSKCYKTELASDLLEGPDADPFCEDCLLYHFGCPVCCKYPGEALVVSTWGGFTHQCRSCDSKGE